MSAPRRPPAALSAVRPAGLRTSPVAELHGGAVEVGGRMLWRDAELALTEGDFTALLGPNGAGKSTLVKVLLGLVPLSAGTATVLGRTARRGDRRIGYLPQRRSFGAQLRIRGRDVVRLGLDGDRWGLPLPGAARWSARARRAAERVDEVVDLVGATPYAGRPIGELSGGEQQRLLIAQALASGPRLLLLDEPLDSLDLPNQAAVAALVARICRQERVAVLMVAHDVNPILAHLDQVACVAGGTLVAGPVRDLVTTERLSGLFGTPVEVLTASSGRTVVVGGLGGHGAHPENYVHETDSAARSTP